MSKPCAHCSSVEHTSFFCYKRPRSRITRSGKRLTHGKVWARWTACKEAWYAKYGKDHLCHYCGVDLGPETITLDHRISRSRAPELRYDFSNLVPCCWECNGLKGSQSHDEYEHTCHTSLERNINE